MNANIEALRPWLLTVARRVAIDAGRARQVRPAEVGTVDLSLLPSGNDPIERMLGGHAIREALAQLSPEHRAVIVEVYFGGRSGMETAQLLGIPVGTVKSRTYNALRILRAA